MKRVLYVRHGQSDANLKGVFAGGGTEALLTDLGREQAAQAGLELKGTSINRIICSPMIRTVETAEIIAKQIDFDTNKIIKDERLREYDTGDSAGTKIEGTTAEKLISAPGAEDPTKFASRVRESLEEISKHEGTTLIVGHGGTARMIECLRTGGEPANFFNSPKKPNAHAFELDLSWIKSEK